MPHRRHARQSAVDRGAAERRSDTLDGQHDGMRGRADPPDMEIMNARVAGAFDPVADLARQLGIGGIEQYRGSLPHQPDRPVGDHDGTEQAERATVDTLLESEAQVMITGFNIASEGAQVLLKRVKMTPLKRVQEALFKVTSLLTCGHPGVVGWLPLPGWVFGTEPQSCGGPVEVGFRLPSDTTTEADFDKLVISLKTLKAVSDNLSPSLVGSGFTFTTI